MDNSKETPVVAQAEDDLLSTSTAPSEDLSIIPSKKYDYSSMHGDEKFQNDCINGPAGNEKNFASFFNETNIGGALVEMTLEESRPLNDLLLSKVTSQATRDLNDSLMSAANFTDDVKQEMFKIRERKDQCRRILLHWSMQDRTPKRVVDLKHLLEQAGPNNEYTRIIDHIVNSP